MELQPLQTEIFQVVVVFVKFDFKRKSRAFFIADSIRETRDESSCLPFITNAHFADRLSVNLQLRGNVFFEQGVFLQPIPRRIIKRELKPRCFGLLKKSVCFVGIDRFRCFSRRIGEKIGTRRQREKKQAQRKTRAISSR